MKFDIWRKREAWYSVFRISTREGRGGEGSQLNLITFVSFPPSANNAAQQRNMNILSAKIKNSLACSCHSCIINLHQLRLRDWRYLMMSSAGNSWMWVSWSRVRIGKGHVSANSRIKMKSCLTVKQMWTSRLPWAEYISGILPTNDFFPLDYRGLRLC